MAATANPAPSSIEFQAREKQILLTALAKDVLASTGSDCCTLEDGADRILILRDRGPVLIKNLYDYFPADYAAELERRLANLGEGKLVLEFTDDLDDDQSKES